MNSFTGSILENVRMGLDTLWQHKLRSFLTVLGVVIGTMTVIVIAAFVSGIDQRVAKEIESFGTNSIYVYRFDPGFNFNPSAEERMRKPLSYEDALAIGSECPSVIYTAAFMSPVDFFGGPFTERVYVRHRDIELNPMWYIAGYTRLKLAFTEVIIRSDLPVVTKGHMVKTLDKYIAIDMALAMSAYDAVIVD